MSSIVSCVEQLQKIKDVNQIIIVDGGSTDGTLEYIKTQDCQILFDLGQGLGAARNLGLSIVSSEFVLNCGADNVMNEKLVNKMLLTLSSEPHLLGVSCRTSVADGGTLGKILDIQWSGRITAGNKERIGTPSLFKTQLLKKYQFSEARTWSDDEELCTRMKLGEGGDFKVIDEFCLEVGQSELRKLRHRYLGYGKSDFEVWKANSGDWTILRRFQSLLHPFKSEFLSILKNTRQSERLMILPLLFFSTFYRYLGWLLTAILNRKRHVG